MFFKVIYYLIGLGLVVYKVYRLSNPEQTKDFWDIFRWHEKAKEDGTEPTSVDEWKEKLGVDTFNNVIMMAILAIVEFSWFFVGIFTYNWALLLAFMVYSFVSYRIMKPKLKTYQSSFVSYTNTQLFLGICIILFAVINSFHLHIDLVKLIFGG